VVDGLILRGWVARPWIGISYNLPKLHSFAHKIRGGQGVALKSVAPGGPAYRAGLRPGDVLRRLGSVSIQSADDIYGFVESHKPGDRVDAVVLRGGDEQKASLVLGEQPSEKPTRRRS
jgi:S1-C subfamily serine protease